MIIVVGTAKNTSLVIALIIKRRTIIDRFIGRPWPSQRCSQKATPYQIRTSHSERFLKPLACHFSYVKPVQNLMSYRLLLWSEKMRLYFGKIKNRKTNS